MHFNFPTKEEEFTKQQQEIWLSNSKGKYMISGAPGTGKTVMAIWRANSMKKEINNPSYFITFGSLLNQYCSQVMEDPSLEYLDKLFINNNVKTYYKFMEFWCYQYLGISVPKLPSHKKNDDFPPVNYGKIIEKIKEKYPNNSDYPKLNFILDEAQDIEPEFFSHLIALVGGDFTICADEHQKLYSNNTTLSEIKKKVFLDDENHVYLNKNFRNNKKVALALLYIYRHLQGDEDKIPDLPTRDGQPPIIKKSTNREIINNIVNLSQNSSDSIGIFLPGIELVDEFFQLIFHRTKSNTNYSSKYSVAKFRSYDFDTEQEYHKYRRELLKNMKDIKILVTTIKSSKGLEFDHVFVPNIQGIRDSNDISLDNKSAIMELYVALSRPRKTLTVTHDGSELAIIKFIESAFEHWKSYDEFNEQLDEQSKLTNSKVTKAEYIEENIHHWPKTRRKKIGLSKEEKEDLISKMKYILDVEVIDFTDLLENHLTKVYKPGDKHKYARNLKLFIDFYLFFKKGEMESNVALRELGRPYNISGSTVRSSLTRTTKRIKSAITRAYNKAVTLNTDELPKRIKIPRILDNSEIETGTLIEELSDVQDYEGRRIFSKDSAYFVGSAVISAVYPGNPEGISEIEVYCECKYYSYTGSEEGDWNINEVRQHKLNCLTFLSQSEPGINTTSVIEPILLSYLIKIGARIDKLNFASADFEPKDVVF